VTLGAFSGGMGRGSSLALTASSAIFHAKKAVILCYAVVSSL
jgi:hypothetical protein